MISLQTKNDWNSLEKYAFDMWEARAKQSSILQDLPIEAQKDWNTISFKTLDHFLKKHCKEITCGDVSAIYWKFWWDLKKIKSNSTNFVGYSELLIIRLFLHFLKSEYYFDNDPDCYSTPNPDSPSNDLGYFVLSNGDLKLTMATEVIPKTFKDSLGNRRPDMILYDDNSRKIFSIVQVKSYPASAESVRSDLKFIDEVRSKHSDIRGLVVLFFGCKRDFCSDPRVLKLADNNLRISEVFRDRLELERLRSIS